MSTTEIKIKLPHMRLPAELHSFLDRLTLNLYRLSKPSTAKELKDKDPSLPDPITIGRGMAYLEYLGIVKLKGGKGIYELTDKGRKIGIKLYQNKNEKANEIWKEILQKHPLYKHIQEYIQKEGGGVRGSTIGLAEYLRVLANKKWKTGFLKIGGQRLCNIFAAKGLLTYDTKEDSISIPPQIGVSAPSTSPPSRKPPPKPPSKGVTLPPSLQQQSQKLAPSPAFFNVDVQLKIEISKDTTPELADKIFNFLLELSKKGIQISSEEKID